MVDRIESAWRAAVHAADLFVAGSSVFAHEDPVAAYRELSDAVQ